MAQWGADRMDSGRGMSGAPESRVGTDSVLGFSDQREQARGASMKTDKQNHLEKFEKAERQYLDAKLLYAKQQVLDEWNSLLAADGAMFKMKLYVVVCRDSEKPEVLHHLDSHLPFIFATKEQAEAETCQTFGAYTVEEVEVEIEPF
jgi:hypothetical protein